jgi:hypothetical protein
MWKLGAVLALTAPLAYAEPWLCSDEYGNRVFSYEPESATQKNCVHQPIPPGNVVRLRPREAGAPAQRAPGFGKIDARTQQQRDLARRQILERELAEEQKSLAAVTQELAERRVTGAASGKNADRTLKPLEDRVRLHQSNIENLRKELGRSS